MTTSTPRAFSPREYSLVRAGERCAEVMSISYGMANSASAFAASFMMSRSESLPITMETRGLLAIIAILILRC